MTKTKIQYETGATSHAINDLILYTENTRPLAKMRDMVYTEWATGKKVPHSFHFLDLLKTASFKYRRELGLNNSKHVEYNALTNDQRLEYMDLYAQDYENWKKENGFN